MALRELGPRWLLCATAAAIALYLLGRWQGMASAADMAAESNAQAVLKLKAPYLAKLGQLRQLEQVHQGSALVWHHRADSLRSLALIRDTVLVADSAPLSLWRATANACQQESAEVATALAACQERAALAQQRAAVLDSSLSALLKVKRCKILFLRCPSRTATFLVGSGLGFAGGLLVSH